MPAKLTTHVLDIANGCPAASMRIELWSLRGEERQRIVSTQTNADGRTDAPLLNSKEIEAGQYEIIFFVGEYFSAQSSDQPTIPFLDQVPVRFGLADADASYHVPLLCSPWAYSTYRGS